MALNVLVGLGDGNEYQDAAEAAMRKAKAQDQAMMAAAGGGGGSPIAVVLDLLGINHSVAKGPKKGNPADTGDLASTPAAPSKESVAVVDKKGDVVDTVERAIKEPPTPTVQPLAMAPLTLSNDGLPRSIPTVDPNFLR